MKNFMLVQAPASRREAFLLLHLGNDLAENEREFIPFTHYALLLANRGYSNNTVKSYCENVARFIDYVYEASLTDYSSRPGFSLENVIYSYQSFLLFGKDASNPLANELAHRFNKNKLTSQSSLSQNIQSSILWFLQESALRLEAGQPDLLFSRFFTTHPTYRSSSEIAAHKSKSWLASTIRGSLKQVIPTRKGVALFPQTQAERSAAFIRQSLFLLNYR